MHFGRRNKSPWRWGRRAKEVPEEPTPIPEEDELVAPERHEDSGAVVIEERSALLRMEQDGAAQAPQANVDAVEPEGNWTALGDPTQQLLSVFGRIEPEIQRGRTGEPQEVWVDPIMDHLAESVKVAAAEDWIDLVTVLTETCGVLRTYRDADRAAECVPLIEDSSEILSLMVGDLIVDKVRSGVMQKWRDRYEEALADLAAAGLVVLDTKAVGEGAESPRMTDGQFEIPVEGEAEPDEGAPWQAAGVQGEVEAVVAEQDEPCVEDSPLETVLDEVCEEVEEISAETEDAPMAEPEEATRGEIEQAAASQLAELREALAVVSVDPENTPRSTYAAVDKCLVVLAREAESENRVEVCEACRVMARMCCTAYRQEAVPNDRFFELAYAFCDVYFETEGTGDWIEECSRFLGAWTEEPELVASQELAEAPEVEAEPEPVPEPEPEPVPEEEPEPEPEAEPVPEEKPEPSEGSAEQLLDIAQRAASAGNAAGAKKLALRAAAQIAQLQIAEAETQLQGSEARFRESANSIEAISRDVEQAKQEVDGTERRVRESQEEVDAQVDRLGQVQSRLEETRGRLAELDEQLREMQERRDEVERERGETETEVASMKERQVEVLKGHETCVEDERRARDYVEKLQEQEKELHWKRAAIEADMTQARENLEEQQVSAADIAKTIGETPGTDSEKPDGSGAQLF